MAFTPFLKPQHPSDEEFDNLLIFVWNDLDETSET